MTTEAKQETAVIKISPHLDQGVVALHLEACNLRRYALALIISNNEDVKRATNDLSILSKLKKALEDTFKVSSK